MKKRMKYLLFFAVIACLLGLGVISACTQQGDTGTTNDQSTQAGDTQGATTQTVTDDAGRVVTFPAADQLSKIYYTGASGQIFCFSLAPELCAGTGIQFSDTDLQYLPAGTGDLPDLGTVSGGKQLNPEAILAAGIQVIFSVTMSTPGDTDVSDANDLQSQTGVPVVILDGSLDKTADTYRKLGTMLGKQDAAEQLASYSENALQAVSDAVASVPDSEKVTLYYAEGSDGLQTEPVDSSHAEAFALAGAVNVADVAVTSGQGMSPVSLEQVLLWNPDVIIAWDATIRGGASDLIKTDPNWATIKAVQDGKVYTMPNTPFAWCDRPPAANRILGIQWLAHTLYPSYYNIDMVQTTKDFYKLFYHCDLTDDQAKAFLGNSIS